MTVRVRRFIITNNTNTCNMDPPPPETTTVLNPVEKLSAQGRLALPERIQCSDLSLSTARNHDLLYVIKITYTLHAQILSITLLAGEFIRIEAALGHVVPVL